MKAEAGKTPAAAMIAVERIVRVLHAVETSDSLRLADAARITGLNEATVLRYLNSLASLGLVERREGPTYRLGWELVRLGRRALHSYTPSDAIRPAMESLLERYNETVNFAFNRDDAMVLIDVLQGNRAVKKVSHVGQVDPWHASALGKAVMSTMSTARLEELVRTAGLPRFTSHTITDHELFLAEIDRTRERGFAVDREELDEDCTCIAAPVVLAGGEEATHALSVSFIAHHVTNRDLEEIGHHVKAAAAEIADRTW